MRVLQVPGRRPQRLQQHRPGQRRQPERARQRPVVLEPPRQPAADPSLGVVGRTDLPVRPGKPLQLVAGHRAGQLGQARLGGRGRDPGQRPHLGIRQPPRAELPPDHRQVPQRPRHPHMLPRGTRGHLALPRQPRRTAGHLPVRPAPAGIEVPQQDQEPARGRGQMPGQLTDLRLQPLQRHRVQGHCAIRAGVAGVVSWLSNMSFILIIGSDIPGCSKGRARHQKCRTPVR